MAKSILTYIWTTISDIYIIKFIAGAVVAVLASIYGSYTDLLNLVLILFGIDFFLGFGRSMINRRTSSKRAFTGALKFLGYGILIVVGHSLDLALHTGSVWTSFFIAFIIISDSISIIENLHLLGFNVPIQVVQYLHVAQEKLNEKIMTSLGVSQMEPDAVLDDTSSIDHKKDEHIDSTNPEP